MHRFAAGAGTRGGRSISGRGSLVNCGGRGDSFSLCGSCRFIWNDYQSDTRADFSSDV